MTFYIYVLKTMLFKYWFFSAERDEMIFIGMFNIHEVINFRTSIYDI